jgi:hypothetical protein
MWYKTSARMGINLHGLDDQIVQLLLNEYVPFIKDNQKKLSKVSDYEIPALMKERIKQAQIMNDKITTLIRNSTLFKNPPEVVFTIIGHPLDIAVKNQGAAGFYDPKTNCIYMRDSYFVESQNLARTLSIIPHELIHALDHQYKSLTNLPDMDIMDDEIYKNNINTPLEVKAYIQSIWTELKNSGEINKIKDYNSLMKTLKWNSYFHEMWKFLTPENKKYILQVLYNKLFNSPPEKDVIRKENVV